MDQGREFLIQNPCILQYRNELPFSVCKTY